jgi:hypothetical protein
VVVTGTVVVLLLSSDADLFLADRAVCGVGLVRRVLTLPSGVLG